MDSKVNLAFRALSISLDCGTFALLEALGLDVSLRKVLSRQIRTILQNPESVMEHEHRRFGLTCPNLISLKTTTYLASVIEEASGSQESEANAQLP